MNKKFNAKFAVSEIIFLIMAGDIYNINEKGEPRNYSEADLILHERSQWSLPESPCIIEPGVYFISDDTENGGGAEICNEKWEWVMDHVTCPDLLALAELGKVALLEGSFDEDLPPTIEIS